MKKIVCIVLIVFGILSFQYNFSYAKGPDFIIKFQIGSPPGVPWAKYGSEPLAKYIEDAANGRVEVKTYPPGALSSWKDILRAVGSGIVDMAYVWHPILPGRFPLMELFSLPGLSESQSVSNHVYLELKDKYPAFDKKYTEEDNVVELMSMVVMRSDLHTIKPIKTLDDLKGKVIACQDETGAQALKMLGASGSIMLGSDTYMAAQRKVVDGVMAAWGWVYSFKVYEVTSYHTLMGLNPGTMSWIMNKDTYNKFNDYEKMILAQLGKNTPAGYIRGNVTNVVNMYKNHLKKENIFRLSNKDQARLRKLFKPKWDQWVKKVTAMGYPGQEILDEAVALMDAYNLN